MRAVCARRHPDPFRKEPRQIKRIAEPHIFRNRAHTFFRPRQSPNHVLKHHFIDISSERRTEFAPEPLCQRTFRHIHSPRNLRDRKRRAQTIRNRREHRLQKRRSIHLQRSLQPRLNRKSSDVRLHPTARQRLPKHLSGRVICPQIADAFAAFQNSIQPSEQVVPVRRAHGHVKIQLRHSPRTAVMQRKPRRNQICLLLR